MSEPGLKIHQRGFEYGVKHVLSPRSGMLSAVLACSLEIPEESAQRLIQLGAVYVETVRATEDVHVGENAYLRIHTRPRRFPSPITNWSDRIVFTHADFVVIKKPSALPCHASVDNLRENLLAYLGEATGEEFFITHRLDVPTAGLLVLARNKEFQRQFNTLLKEKKVRKIYRALCTGKTPRTGSYVHYMEESPRAPKKVSTVTSSGARCELIVRSCAESETGPREYEIEIELLTGRTHQIRAQMAFEGSPLRGDVMYGGEKVYEAERIDLCATELSFAHPVSREEFHFKIEDENIFKAARNVGQNI